MRGLPRGALEHVPAAYRPCMLVLLLLLRFNPVCQSGRIT